jgi:MazG family protein
MDALMDERWQDIRKIWEIIDQLRGEPGCPWDRKQTPESVQTYLVEEAHEAAAAVRSGDIAEAAEELGDLLFMVFFLIHLYEEAGMFTLRQVGEKICDKMVRRHPHVFGDVTVKNTREVRDNWEKIKAGEKKRNRNNNIDSVPESLPALIRAYRLLSRISRDRPDWDDAASETGLCKEVVARVCAAQEQGAAASERDFAEALLRLVNLARLNHYRAEDLLHSYLKRWVAEASS